MKTENVFATKDVPAGSGMKVRTNLKAGALSANHNQTVARGLRVKSSVKAGALLGNHNQTTIRAAK